MSKTLIAACVVGTYFEALLNCPVENMQKNVSIALFSVGAVGTIRLPFVLLAVQVLPSKFKWIVPAALYCTAAYHASRFKSVE